VGGWKYRIMMSRVIAGESERCGNKNPQQHVSYDNYQYNLNFGETYSHVYNWPCARTSRNTTTNLDRLSAVVELACPSAAVAHLRVFVANKNQILF